MGAVLRKSKSVQRATSSLSAIMGDNGVPVLMYSDRINKWEPQAANSAKTSHFPLLSDSDLKVITFNIWFSERYWAKRCEELISTISSRRPHVAVLQEVCARTVKYILEHKRIQDQYALTDPNVVTRSNWYGLLTLVRKDVATAGGVRAEYHFYGPHKTNLGRGLLLIQFDADKDLCVTVGNTHLESPIPGVLASHRAAQLEMCAEIFAKQPKPSWFVLGGDFNFMQERETETLGKLAWIDAWRHCHPDEEGLTFDGPNNPLVSNPAYISRPDIITFPREGLLAITSIERLGMDDIPTSKDVKISDHYGLQAIFKAAYESKRASDL